MATFIIFWYSVLAVISFILWVIFKASVSLLNALLVSIREAITVGGLTVLLGLVLYYAYGMVEQAVTGKFMVALGTIVILLILIAVIFFLFGVLVLGIAYAVFNTVLCMVSMYLEKIAGMCGSSYEKCMKVIVNRIEGY